MPGLSQISLVGVELERRTSTIAIEDSFGKVIDLLGGNPYQTEWEGKKLRAFWRFRILDREEGDPYEIYLGEFVNDHLVFKFILPHS